MFKFNSFIGKALIQNNSHKITDTEIEYILKEDSTFTYKYLVTENFKDIYYLENENKY